MNKASRYYNPDTGRFDRSAIMRDVWAGMRRDAIGERLSLRLSVVWAYARAEKRDAEQGSAARAARQLRTSAEILQYKTTMSQADHDRVRALNAAAARLQEAA